MKKFKTLFISLITLVALLSGCGSMGSQVWIPMESEGQKYNLDATLHLPEGKKGPFPVVILSHGSVGPGQIPGPLQQATSFFLEEGFAVLLPMRSGHGRSGGRNHEPLDTAGVYTSGITHAAYDLHAAVNYVKTNPALDASRIVVGGRSRGGLLSVIYAAEAGDPNIKGVINFAGGWQGRAHQLHTGTFRRAGRGIKVPNLWLYATGDAFASEEVVNAYVSAFREGGGQVDFKYYPNGSGGHVIVEYPSVWKKDVQEFLRRLGF